MDLNTSIVADDRNLIWKYLQLDKITNKSFVQRGTAEVQEEYRL